MRYPEWMRVEALNKHKALFGDFEHSNGDETERKEIAARLKRESNSMVSPELQYLSRVYPPRVRVRSK